MWVFSGTNTSCFDQLNWVRLMWSTGYDLNLAQGSQSNIRVVKETSWNYVRQMYTNNWRAPFFTKKCTINYVKCTIKYERWTHQHDTGVGQRRNLSPRREPNPWPPAQCSGGHGFDSCRGLRFSSLSRACHVDQFTFHISLPSSKFTFFVHLFFLVLGCRSSAGVCSSLHLKLYLDLWKYQRQIHAEQTC